MNNLDLIKTNIRNTPLSGSPNDNFYELIERAHNFYLDIDSQVPASSEAAPTKDVWGLTPVIDFKLPFDVCLFAFKDTYKMKYPVPDNRKVGWIGFYIKVLSNGELGVSHSDMDVYAMYPIFLLGRGKAMTMGSYVFGTGLTDDENFRGITIAGHKCDNEEHCGIDQRGTLKEKYRGGGEYIICEHLVMAESIIQTIFRIVDNLNKKKTIYKDSGNKVKNLGKGHKKDFVKEGYVQEISDRRYKYENVNHGAGTKHGHRYDVRRHPRIIDNKIIWVAPHIRGSGEYVSKTYTKHIPYIAMPSITSPIEKLTKKYRLLELILIAFIKLKRKLTR